MFIRKYWIPLSVLGVAICLLGFFLLHSDVPQEPIKIYKTNTPTPRVSKAKKTVLVQAQQKVDSQPHTEESNKDAELTNTGEGELFQAQPHNQQKNKTTHPIPDANTDEDVVTEWIGEQLEILTAQMEEKYPEIARLTELTPAEIRHRYSTPTARHKLQKLAAEARTEFFDDLRDLFSLLPVDVIETALEATRQDLMENFGPEMVDKIILEIRAEMDL